MDNLIKHYFPLYFVLLWLVVMTVLNLLSGWYSLMFRCPNREEKELLKLKHQSGLMGWVSMRGILNISVCPSGLRIGIMKILGIFCRDIFVPWEEIRIERMDVFFGKRLNFNWVILL